ncbi:MAG: LacI family DNA-binding transcriptional regulator [Rhodothermales bacterium]|nr:LacI family DNA-binding transcriptional regulator [Rhodothermales bacterium]
MASTIRDVARQAGVSISTVSRVLNNTCAVAEDKRLRVEKAASALGYVPNPNARSLLMKSTGGMGMLLPHVSGEFFSEFLTGADNVAKDNDFFLLISASHGKASEWRSSVQSVYRRVDGLIVMAPQVTPKRLNLSQDIPTVFVNTPVPERDRSGVDVIGFDNAGGTRQAVEYLLNLGHRRFCYVAGPEGAFDAAERAKGFREALDSAGIRDGVILAGGYNHEDGALAARKILEMDPRPTAVLAANDYCALGLLTELQGAGVDVPGEVSIIGFDNVPSAAFSAPGLTTLGVPIREIGEKAIERLLHRIRRPDDPVRLSVELPVNLVVRDTTAPVLRQQ